MTRTLPGFRLSLSFTLVYLGVLLAVPLAACLFKSLQLSPKEFLAVVLTRQAVAAYLLTFGASFAAAGITSILGLLLAWVLVRYEWPGKRIVDSLVDLPLALPTAVAGLTYSALYAKNGWFGQFLVPLGIHGTYSRLGIVLVLTFIGLPFAVRAVQPVLENLEADAEEAAMLLGASRWQTFWHVILPTLMPAMITGFALSFARSIGEYGSVVFVSSNIPRQTEIAPMLIVSALESSYAEATAIAVVLLAMSFGMLAVVNVLERGVAATMHNASINFTSSHAISHVRADPAWVRRLLIGAALAVVGVLIVAPVSLVFFAAFENGIGAYWHSLIDDPATLHAIKLTLTVAPTAVALNALFGIAAAWLIARFKFPGRTLLITLIDLPFAISPVVAGLMIMLLFGKQGFFGAWLDAHNIHITFAWPAIVLATTFVTMPFVVRELIPVLEATGPEEEIAAISLGAKPWRVFWHVTLPNIKWGLLYGLILCNARAMGEFGAVYVVSGRSDRTSTMPLYVQKLLENRQDQAAFALASLLTLLALVSLGLKVWLERKTRAQFAEAAKEPPHPSPLPKGEGVTV